MPVVVQILGQQGPKQAHMQRRENGYTKISARPDDVEQRATPSITHLAGVGRVLDQLPRKEREALPRVPILPAVTQAPDRVAHIIQDAGGLLTKSETSLT